MGEGRARERKLIYMIKQDNMNPLWYDMWRWGNVSDRGISAAISTHRRKNGKWGGRGAAHRACNHDKAYRRGSPHWHKGWLLNQLSMFNLYPNTKFRCNDIFVAPQEISDRSWNNHDGLPAGKQCSEASSGSGIYGYAIFVQFYIRISNIFGYGRPAGFSL